MTAPGDLRLKTEMPAIWAGKYRIFVPLAREPFERFADGSKTVELRNKPQRWIRRMITGERVELRLGYSTKRSLWGRLGRHANVGCFADLPQWAKDGAGLYGFGARFVNTAEAIIAFEVLP